MSGISEALDAALDSEIPLQDVLRRVVVVSRSLAAADLARWARHELDGYGSSDELPDYRRTRAPMLADAFVTNGRISREMVTPDMLPANAREHFTNEVKLYQPIAELGALASVDEDHVNVLPAGSDAICRLIDHQASFPRRTDRVYYAVARTALLGVLDVVRTRLVALLVELVEHEPAPGRPLSEPVAAAAYRIVYEGAEPATIGPAAKRPSLARRIWLGVGAGVALVAGLVTIASFLGVRVVWPE